MTSSSSSASPPTSSSPGDATDVTEICDICDIRGELCPFTFVRTKLALEALPLGAVLRVLVDHEPAIRNIPRSAIEWGQEVVRVEALVEPGAGPEAPPVWAIDLRKRVR